ncbi:uncharacterized protein BKCO1_5000055 [Diplodia corticola]|uniref:Uncharacterized protein n=1 Tax=Diplodia corticola TaxID=236234 RepID=A0A1J9QQU5_9PEZI|nr:uncharacterized protein BKCO1_5000055 [Diplodia corticola]OJD31302.1 hypothetical protein BKCO1_5000055 [Diplodia corticola]
MSTTSSNSALDVLPGFQSAVFVDHLLPGRAQDTDVMEQGHKIKAIMDELEEQYVHVLGDVQSRRFTIAANWDTERNLPIVYKDGERTDALTSLMVHHATCNNSHSFTFFMPGSSGRIRPCSYFCPFLFIGLYKHIYIRNSIGNVGPMPHVPPNPEEGRALDMVVSAYQRVGFLPAHSSLEEANTLKTQALDLLRTTEAEMLTAQLMMSRVMGEDVLSTVRKDDHDDGPAAEGGQGGIPATLHDQHTATAGNSASQAAASTQTAPHKTTLAVRSKTSSAGYPTHSSADDNLSLNYYALDPSNGNEWHRPVSFNANMMQWLPPQTQSSMARFIASQEAVKSTEGVDADLGSDDARKHTDGEDVLSTDGEDVLSTDGEDVLSTDGEDVLSTDDDFDLFDADI